MMDLDWSFLVVKIFTAVRYFCIDSIMFCLFDTKFDCSAPGPFNQIRCPDTGTRMSWMQAMCAQAPHTASRSKDRAVIPMCLVFIAQMRTNTLSNIQNETCGIVIPNTSFFWSKSIFSSTLLQIQGIWMKLSRITTSRTTPSRMTTSEITTLHGDPGGS